MRSPVQQRLPLAAVLLTALIAFQSVGWLLAWQGLQFGAKIEAQKALFQGGNTLRECTFQKDFIQNIKVGRKEIILNGQLYDYQILLETADSVHVALYYDHHEHILLSALGQIFKSGEDEKIPSSKPSALWLAKCLGSTFLVPEKPIVSSSAKPLFQRQHFAALLFAAQSAPSVFAPPPELRAEVTLFKKVSLLFAWPSALESFIGHSF